VGTKSEGQHQKSTPDQLRYHHKYHHRYRPMILESAAADHDHVPEKNRACKVCSKGAQRGTLQVTESPLETWLGRSKTASEQSRRCLDYESSGSPSPSRSYRRPETESLQVTELTGSNDRARTITLKISRVRDFRGFGK